MERAQSDYPRTCNAQLVLWVSQRTSPGRMEIMQPARLTSYARCIHKLYFPIIPRWSAKMLGWAASTNDADEYLITTKRLILSL